MRQVFILCHEGEIPSVIRGLQDALQDDLTMQQSMSQGSTDKMHMGSVLQEGSEEIPLTCLAELQANPDMYLSAVHDPNAQDDAPEDVQEDEPSRPAKLPLPLEL